MFAGISGLDVEPASMALAQHQTNIGTTSHICCGGSSLYSPANRLPRASASKTCHTKLISTFLWTESQQLGFHLQKKYTHDVGPESQTVAQPQPNIESTFGCSSILGYRLLLLLFVTHAFYFLAHLLFSVMAAYSNKPMWSMVKVLHYPGYFIQSLIFMIQSSISPTSTVGVTIALTQRHV